MKKAANEEEKDECELKICYIDYYPKDLKYVALFPSSGSKDSDDSDDEKQETLPSTSHSDKRRDEVMLKIKEYRRDGKLKPGFVWRWKTRNEETVDPELLDSDPEDELDSAKQNLNDKQELEKEGVADLDKDDFFV